LITSLRLQNFRGFDDHHVPLKENTLIVGANNAGKSTVVEALRLVAVATDRLLRGKSHLSRTPDWLEVPVGPVGLSPSVRGLTSDGLESTLFHQYGDPPAVITANFEGGAQVVVYIGPSSQVHVVARRSDGTAITSIKEASGLNLHPIAAQPQVAPLLRDEPIRADETIRRGEGTYLASQHFRNQLWRAKGRKLYRDFRRIAEDSWPGLQITELEGHLDRPDDPLQLRVRDRGFVGEVSLMGHGFWHGLRRTPRWSLMSRMSICTPTSRDACCRSFDPGLPNSLSRLTPLRSLPTLTQGPSWRLIGVFRSLSLSLLSLGFRL